jgi:hypothetical protein
LSSVKNLIGGEGFYIMTNAGQFKNKEYARQLRSFGGLVFGSISPTDIDGCIEYKNKLFIWIESKFGNAKLPFGQRLAFERINDAIEKSGKPSIFIVANHHAEEDIDLANSIVTEYRTCEKWNIPKQNLTVRKACELFIEKNRKED